MRRAKTLIPEIVVVAISLHSRVSLLSQEPPDTYVDDDAEEGLTRL